MKVKNRHDQDVELDTISNVVIRDDGVEINRTNGWGTLFISNEELDGFVPQVCDAIVTMTTNFSFVRGIIIENRVIRYTTAKQAEKEAKQFTDNIRLRKLEAYIKHGDALRQRVQKLHPRLRARMERFAAEGGVEFWIDSAPYEMAVLEGANALLNKVETLGARDNQVKINWINAWWNMNTQEGGYDYKGQMEAVPDFGDGHSGFTASAAKSLAVAILEGQDV